MPIDSNCCCDRDVQNPSHVWICSGLVYRFDLIGSFGCDMLFCRNWHDILHFFLQDKKVNLFRPAVCGDPDLAIEAHAGSPWLAPSCCSTWTSLMPAPQESGGTSDRAMVWRCMLIHFSLSTIDPFLSVHHTAAPRWPEFLYPWWMLTYSFFILAKKTYSFFKRKC